jgi:clan AA aspartic protease
VDTGFVGFLTLPSAAVAALGLPFLHDTPANLADDSEVQLAVHEATIVWQDEERRVRLLATGKRPLLGMALLDGQELVVQCTDGGLVTVDTL